MIGSDNTITQRNTLKNSKPASHFDLTADAPSIIPQAGSLQV